MLETSEIVKTRLLAKALVIKGDKIIIVAVFERSDYHRFFFHFEAKSKRSPRKSWKYTKQFYGCNAGLGKTFLSLKEYVQARFAGCEYIVRYQKPMNKKHYLTWHRRIALPFENSPQAVPMPGQTFEYANSLTSGKPVWGRNRKIAYKR